MLVDDFTPRYQSDLANPLAVTFTDHNLNPYSLSGVTLPGGIIFHMRNTSTQTVLVAAGTWTITNALGGQATYAWAAADVATAGSYELSVDVLFPSGPIHFDTKVLEILPVF